MPAFEPLRAWAAAQGLPADLSNEALAAHPQVQQLYEAVVEETNRNFASWEQIKKMELVPTLWSVESGELTPTLKLKRKIIRQNNEQRLDALYRG